ncbi:hypothetical protein PFISCL1PPCAC_20154, partial [Pristionchus fissidentatus]
NTSIPPSFPHLLPLLSIAPHNVALPPSPWTPSSSPHSDCRLHSLHLSISSWCSSCDSRRSSSPPPSSWSSSLWLQWTSSSSLLSVL